MDVIIPIFIFSLVLLATFLVYRKLIIQRQISFIKNYKFPETVKSKVSEIYPHLDSSELQQVMRGLKDYFYLIHIANKESVAMPSQIVDVAWHEFILFTREYDKFCSKAFGYFVHHTPAEGMKSPIEAQIGIKRAWELSCKRELINHFEPKRLPVIFALDARLKIKNGFYYELNCISSVSDKNDNIQKELRYCAGHISISADYAPTLDGKPAEGGRGCSGGGHYTGCSGSGGCSSSGD
ncbi:glycine-rich domain-containing protein [Pseudoalteromonas denitrificans]|uniref:Uncharacterized protein n=1 Tax=Pseudoalteromonas denitrificans DSM 6059 TaxID=1123010 RepID=A0A1I1H8Q4_9GAMM|nr:hypothetical protein [Pseudoalteromonas denitrificans]SFC20377.1 hypothetical protein SAMN02745724_01110 [Pseudoalteromonas denitrificans DSM 6059]